jgi:hypothetical protein
MKRFFLVDGIEPEEHQVPMFIAKHGAKRASNFMEWMALLGAAPLRRVKLKRD